MNLDKVKEILYTLFTNNGCKLLSKSDINSIENIPSYNTLNRAGFSLRALNEEFSLISYTTNPALCIKCFLPLPYTKRLNSFCSHSCSAKVSNTTRAKIKTEKKCLSCNTSIHNPESTYCSNKCHANYRYTIFISKWRAGECKGGTESGSVSSYIRRYLFEKYNSKCSRCGWGELNPVTKKSPLEVEHIDGDSSNNEEANLTLLCPNCHSLTPTYKALNKGNGRHNRRTRYAEGKSY